MQKDDDSKNSIDDLIMYAGDEDDSEEDDFDYDVHTNDIKGQQEDADKIEKKKAAEEILPEEDLYGAEDIDTYDNDDFYDDYEIYHEDRKILFKNEKKHSLRGIIIGIIAGLLAVAAFVGVDSGIIGNYKNNFSRNFSKVFSNFTPEKNAVNEQPTQKPDAQYNTDISFNTLITVDNINNAEFVPYRNGIVYAAMNHMSYIDNTGSVVWETDTAVVDPILESEGEYILLAEKGRNKICLYSDKKLLFDTDDPDAVMAAKVSSNGDIVAVTDKSDYRGGISVYNKSGAQIFSWSSGADTVICADISSASRCVAVALLNTDTQAKTVIQLFDVNRADSYARAEVEDTVVYDMQFTGDMLTAFGDNRLVTLTASGKLIKNNLFSDMQLTHSAMDRNGTKILSFANGNVPMLNMYNKRGAEKDSLTLTGVTDFIAIKGKNVLYNIGRDVYFGKMNSKNMAKYTAKMDIRNLIAVSADTFVIVYSNSLEIVTI